jgi:hypothetical protein
MKRKTVFVVMFIKVLQLIIDGSAEGNINGLVFITITLT